MFNDFLIIGITNARSISYVHAILWKTVISTEFMRVSFTEYWFKKSFRIPAVIEPQFIKTSVSCVDRLVGHTALVSRLKLSILK